MSNEDLKQIEQQLIEAAAAKIAAVDAAMEAEKKYDGLWDKLIAENAEFQEAWNNNGIKQLIAKQAKADYAEAKKEAKDKLSAMDNPDVIKAIDAFSYTRHIEPDYKDDYATIQMIVDSGMLFLLKPDAEAIKAFVKGMAIEDKETGIYRMPDKVFDMLEIEINTVIKPTISDAKITKLAK
jgi:hypothetical protein